MTPSTPDPARSAAYLTPGERRLLATFVEQTLATLDTAGIERILVFGSRARGGGHADSDLDVAVFAAATAAPATLGQLADLAAEAQAGFEDLPHLRPLLLRTGEPANPALLRAITREGIELWAKKNA